jgi:ABC-2 type transport system ATP-binding protein
MDTISADRLTVHRGGRRVLDEVSFSVGAGEVFALLGGNGAGKSTTLLTLLGLLVPTAGEARVLGAPVAGNPDRLRASVAYLPETAALYGHLSARENIAYFLSLAGQRRTRHEIEADLDRVRLARDARDGIVERYSKGMRQRVAIALALLRRTPVLLLDEPSSGLDPIAIDELNELIAELARDGVTTLMVTHDVYGACHVARRVGLLRDGRIVGVFDGGSDGRIDPETVRRAFSEKVAA